MGRHRSLPGRGLWAAVVGATVAASVVLLPPVAGAVPVPWRNCGQQGDVITVQELDASVWPPVHGQPLTLEYRAQVASRITGGTADVQLGFPSGRVASFSVPLRPPPPLHRFPVPAGPLHGTVTVTVPHWLRPGDVYGLHVDARSEQGAQLVCFDVVIPIK